MAEETGKQEENREVEKNTKPKKESVSSTAIKSQANEETSSSTPLMIKSIKFARFHDIDTYEMACNAADNIASGEPDRRVYTLITGHEQSQRDERRAPIRVWCICVDVGAARKTSVPVPSRKPDDKDERKEDETDDSDQKKKNNKKNNKKKKNNTNKKTKEQDKRETSNEEKEETDTKENKETKENQSSHHVKAFGHDRHVSKYVNITLEWECKRHREDVMDVDLFGTKAGSMIMLTAGRDGRCFMWLRKPVGRREESDCCNSTNKNSMVKCWSQTDADWSAVMEMVSPMCKKYTVKGEWVYYGRKFGLSYS